MAVIEHGTVGDMVVAVGEMLEVLVVGGDDRPRPLLRNCFRQLSAMAPPICGSVPVPNSSMRISVLALACFIIFFMLNR